MNTVNATARNRRADNTVVGRSNRHKLLKGERQIPLGRDDCLLHGGVGGVGNRKRRHGSEDIVDLVRRNAGRALFNEHLGRCPRDPDRDNRATSSVEDASTACAEEARLEIREGQVTNLGRIRRNGVLRLVRLGGSGDDAVLGDEVTSAAGVSLQNSLRHTEEGASAGDYLTAHGDFKALDERHGRGHAPVCDRHVRVKGEGIEVDEGVLWEREQDGRRRRKPRTSR